MQQCDGRGIKAACACADDALEVRTDVLQAAHPSLAAFRPTNAHVAGMDGLLAAMICAPAAHLQSNGHATG